MEACVTIILGVLISLECADPDQIGKVNDITGWLDMLLGSVVEVVVSEASGCSRVDPALEGVLSQSSLESLRGVLLSILREGSQVSRVLSISGIEEVFKRSYRSVEIVHGQGVVCPNALAISTDSRYLEAHCAFIWQPFTFCGKAVDLCVELVHDSGVELHSDIQEVLPCTKRHNINVDLSHLGCYTR